MKRQRFTGLNVLILGLARQGIALARFFAMEGSHVVVSDRRDATQLQSEMAVLRDYGDVHFALGGHPLSLLDGVDLLCLSGGVPPTIPIVREARRRGIALSNDSLLTLQLSPAPIIGITGSSGKTTTTTLVGKMLAASGLRTHVGGNIGTPLIDRLTEIAPADRVVLELSSFQLELWDRSPWASAVLNVTPNHLDRHPSMAAYAAAKQNIWRYQRRGDLALLGWDNEWTRRWYDQLPAGVERLAFSLREEVPAGAWLAGDRLVYQSPGGEAVPLFPRSAIRLRGEHNVLNVLAAAALALAVGGTVDGVREVGTTFTGVAHRLEVVRRRHGVTWVNDSIATAPERAVAALRSFDEPLILLAGGRDKKLPWEEFARLVHRSVRHLVLFGESAEMIARKIAEQTAQPGEMLESVRVVDDLPAAVAAADEVSRPGDVVLLSPGGTSYDAYKDFVARGEHFRHLVTML